MTVWLWYLMVPSHFRSPSRRLMMSCENSLALTSVIRSCASSNEVIPKRFFFFPAEDGIRARTVTGVQTCALPIFHVDVGGIGARVVVAQGHHEPPVAG